MRFRLRTLFALTALVAIATTIVAFQRRRAEAIAINDATYFALESYSAMLDLPIRKYLASLPHVAQSLESFDGGPLEDRIHGGQSKLVTRGFNRANAFKATYNYSWAGNGQVANPSNQILVTATAALITPESWKVSPVLLQLNYKSSEENQGAAAAIVDFLRDQGLKFEAKYVAEPAPQ